MKFAKTKDPETNKSVPDKTTVIYKPRTTLRNIPLDAYVAIVDGKPIRHSRERGVVFSVGEDGEEGAADDIEVWLFEEE